MVKQFVNEERIVIGQGSGVQIDLVSPDVSSIHCLVEKREDGFYLCDLGSEQGTFINGNQILDQKINSGDHFEVGSFSIYFMQGNQKTVEIDEKVQQAAAVSSLQPPAASEVEQTKTVNISQVQNQPDAAQVKPTEAVVKNSPVTHEQKPKQSSVNVAKTDVVKSDMSKSAKINKANSLKDFIRVGAGSRVEVIVSWHERILNTYHFSAFGERSLGGAGDISVPDGAAPKGWKILNYSGSQLEVNITNEMKAEIIRDGDLRVVNENKFFVRESEVCFIELGNGIQLAIRFAPKAPPIIFDSPFVLGISEFTGVLAALILAVVMSLIISVTKPKPEPEEEAIERLAKVVFTKPPQPTPVSLEEQPTPKEEPKKEVEIKKVNLSDKKQDTQSSVNKETQKKGGDSSSGKAAEIKPKDTKLKAKMFTSTKSGGAIKTGDVNGANAKSKEPDLKNSGLLAAFGTGGARNKLDKAYSGSGELIGAGEKATGASGFNSNRSGDDLGSRAKDTGAGGSGTATQGIAGVGTQGRGTGNAGFGSGTGFGDKGKVQIDAGGSEEEFTGSIDKEAVRRVVKSALAQFKACYEREYRMNSKLEGKVVVQWEIHEQGVAKNAKIVRVKSTINNASVEECVKNRMMALKFPEPPPGTAAEVTYPFIFQGQKL